MNKKTDQKMENNIFGFRSYYNKKIEKPFVWLVSWCVVFVSVSPKTKLKFWLF
jgi:hypothetical protein